VPRTAIEAYARALGVTETYAAAYLKRLPYNAEWDAKVAAFQARTTAADLEAARSLDEADIEDVAEADDPRAELQDLVEERSQRHLLAQIAAHRSWANTIDPTARTAPARRAFIAKFEREVDPDGALPPAERARRAEHARKAFYLSMALKSAQARKRKQAV